jgi:hypothetical protein
LVDFKEDLRAASMGRLCRFETIFIFGSNFGEISVVLYGRLLVAAQGLF